VLVLTEDATVVCMHELGNVDIEPTQALVTIARRRILVEKDPEGRSIAGCPNIGATIRPCQTTLEVRVGYSSWIRIAGRRVVLDNLSGLTDGTPPGLVKYKVRAPGQVFVDQGSPP
jgi:hypothetical protein